MSQNRTQTNDRRSSRGPKRGPKRGPNGGPKNGSRKTFHTSERRSDQKSGNSGRSANQRQRSELKTARRAPNGKPAVFATGKVDGSLPGFTGFGLDSKLLKGIDAMGFEEPTPIQTMGVPPAMLGRDVLACAMTGSGKTASFLLPVLQRLLKTRGSHPQAVRALALTPTRELAAQIVEQFNDLGRFTGLKAVAVYGGVGMRPQEQAFRRGVDLMVACPGRLLDHLTRPYADLQDLEVLVLDEVDRMLDMGFLPDVKRILKQIPSIQQTLCYSATMPRDIVQLTDELQDNPVKLQVERESKPAEGVRQTLFPVHEGNKRDLLVDLLKGPDIFNALVFTRTKHRANRLALFLSKSGVKAERIHGNRSQAQRTRALDQFKKGKARVLVATDVAARGIDVEELSHVINFDVPNVPEDYIHRVGRTARAERTGDAFSFVSQSEESFIRGIEKALGEKLPRRHPDGTVTDVRSQASSNGSNGNGANGSGASKTAQSAAQGASQGGNNQRTRPKHHQHSGRKKTSGQGRQGGKSRSRSRSRSHA